MNKRLVWLMAILGVLVLGVGGGVLAAVVWPEDDEPSQEADPDPSDSPSSAATPTAPTSGEPNPGVGEIPEGLEAFYTQQLDWSSCGGNECSLLTVPINYKEPDGATIQLKIERAPALDQDDRIGSVVVNPGGPGAPGTQLVEDPTYAFTEDLREKVDLVAFDPRGTGESDPIDCLSDSDLDAFVAMDPAPDDDAEASAAVQAQEDFFAGCIANSDDLIGHVSTVEVAMDMDVLRAVLGEKKLSYLGFSYGTTLGSTYAELFPQNVGRFVLDGATDPTLDFKQDSLSQAAGFQTALEAYLKNCVDDGGCFLGGSVEAGLQTISDLLDKIDAEPLPTSLGRDLTVGNAFYGLVTPLYSRDNWSFLDTGLQEALDGKGDTLLFLSDFYGSRNLSGGYDDNSLEAILAINCLDDPAAVDPDDVPSYYQEFEKASPTFGRVFAWGLIGCHGIKVEATYPAPEIHAEGADPILVLGTTRDPATPYEEAVALASQLDSGVLISRDGDGHTAYNKNNDCVDEAVDGYLLEGIVPENDLKC